MHHLVTVFLISSASCRIQIGHLLQMIPMGAVQQIVQMDLCASRSMWTILKGLADRNARSI